MHKSKANHARWDSEGHTLRERKRVCVYVSSWVDFTVTMLEALKANKQDESLWDFWIDTEE